jgi:SHS family lactate transporter-like MFS transporter
MTNSSLQAVRTHWHVLTAATLGWFLDAFDFTILLFLIPHLRQVFNVSLPAMALVVTATALAKVVGNVVWGAAADKWGRKLPFMIGVLWFSVFCGLSGLAWSYGALLVLRIIFGLGYGGEWSASAPLLMESLPEYARGLASGIMMAGYEVGYLVAALAFRIVFPTLGWRWMFFLGVIPALLAVFIRARVSESPVWLATRGQPQAREPLRLNAPAAQAWAFMACVNFMSYAVFGLYPTFLITVRHMSPAGVFPFIATYSIASIVGKPLIGQLTAVLGERAMAVTYMLLTIPSTLLYTLNPSYTATIIGAVLMGLIANGVFGIVPSYLSRRFPTAVRSTGMGTGYAIAGATGALAPYIVAGFTHQWGLATSMAVFIALGAVLAAFVASFNPSLDAGRRPQAAPIT